MESLQSLLGIDMPIIQAPMAGAQGHELAAAVSNAGGLGSLPCASLTPEAMHAELSALRRLTDKPFNVNFFAHCPPTPQPGCKSAWREALSPYYQEYGLSLTESTADAAGRAPFNYEALEVLTSFRPSVVSFHFGLPSEDLLSKVKGLGCKILSSATTLEEGLWLEAHGVDVIIAQGLEAGGHRGHFLASYSLSLQGQMGTFALVPQLVKSVNVPIVAAGGIACCKGVNAAMALGSGGVQVGTAYLLCPESRITALHRAALKRPNPAARTTDITNVFTGRPARGIINRLMREKGPLNTSGIVPEFPLASATLTPLRVKAEEMGCSDFSPLWSGQNSSGCREVPAGQLTRDLAAGFRRQ